ncbi:hypothetical protein IFM89_038860 [Coptis chinensis]|uniref:Peptidase M48 domain-containing protein n=1 Tax=Coptis chinensis TaxID=261450 RepID=A0A835I470_9MAGN|nr:hypothetical protein IFM89_038860 [Coptis chinensis]
MTNAELKPVKNRERKIPPGDDDLVIRKVESVMGKKKVEKSKVQRKEESRKFKQEEESRESRVFLITSFRNLTNSTTQLYGKTIIPTCKPPSSTTSFQRYYLSDRASVVLVASGILVAYWIGTLYYVFCYLGGRIENVPYTNRKHFVRCSPMKEKQANFRLEAYKTKYKGKLLDEKEPHSVRAKLILKNIIQGLEREVKRNPNSNASGFNHYDKFNWNILVVDELGIHAISFAGGTICISRGTLEITDGEIATVIAHEVGHIVARHPNEIPQLVSRCKIELEADYIGLLLMASAGYNPRIAVEFWKIISLSNPDVSKGDLYYPSYEERGNSLAQAHVMEQALTIYKEVTPRRPVN